MKESNEFSKRVRKSDNFSINSLNKFEKIEIPIILKSFIERNSNNNIAKDLRKNKLNS